MNAALTHLGYNVYDALENSVWLGEEYEKIFKEGWVTEDFRKIYEHVDAVTDVPACFVWDEIHKAFPDAKIILTVREDENVWCESLKVQLQVLHQFRYRVLQMLSPTLRKITITTGYATEPSFTQLLGIKISSIWSSKVRINEQMAKLRYRSHNAYVMEGNFFTLTAPKDKLLIYKCSEGWEPLCKFLGVPIPDCPFPHKNVKGSIVKEMAENGVIKEVKKEMLRSLAILAITGGIVTYCTYKYGPVVLEREGCNHMTALFGKLYPL